MADHAESVAHLAEVGPQLITGVERAGPEFVRLASARVADAWEQQHPLDRGRLDAELADAANVATARVVDELRRLLAQAPPDQRATPLEVVRGIVTEPTAILEAAGIPPVVRDGVQERLRPDDPYDLVPGSLADLDEALGPLQLVWGLAKAAAIRANRVNRAGPEG